MQPGDTLLDGKVVIVSVDQQGNATSVKFPTITDSQTGEPLVLSFNYGQGAYYIELIAHSLGL